MKIDKTKSLLFAFLGLFFALSVNAASSLFSNYGQIQNVQGYSSNPFWTPNSSYNSTLPRPVYAKGPALDSEDCINVVQSLVAVQCMVRDNCKDTKLSDIRPAIMVQLSSLPEHNYVSACSGYIDAAYEKYVEYYGNSAPTRQVAFPTGTIPNQNLNNDTIQIENPYKQKIPEWQQKINERSQELERLQQQNAPNISRLSTTDFPATYADLSFSERIANEAAGLEPYKDLKAYKELNVINASEWCDDHADSRECLKFLCSPGGKNADDPKCIDWRCNDATYRAKNKIECETNKYCAGKENSEKCKKFKCAHDSKYFAENIAYCACLKNKNSNECMEQRCSEQSEERDSAACMKYRCNHTEKDTDTCIKWLCENDTFYKTANRDKCMCIDNKDSYECMKQRCARSSTEKDTDMCVKWLCENDNSYKNSYQDRCACLDNKDSDACMKYRCSSDSAERDTDACVSWLCKNDRSYKTSHQDKCGDIIFVARIRKQHKIEGGEGHTGKNGKGCYAVCGESLTDNLNSKVLYPMFHKRFCADKEQGGLMIDAANNEPLQMTQEELDNIRQKIASSVADQDNCDYNLYNFLFQVGKFYSGTTDFMKLEEIYLDD